MGCEVFATTKDGLSLQFSQNNAYANVDDLVAQIVPNQWSRVTWRFSEVGMTEVQFYFSRGSVSRPTA